MSAPAHSRTDVIAGSVLAVASAAALLWLIPSFVDGPVLPDQFSPRFFPSFAVTVVLVLSLVLTVQGLARMKEAPAPDPAAPFLVQAALWAVFCALVLAGVSYAGFLATAIVALLVWGFAAGGRNLKILVPAGLALPPLISFAVNAAFGVQLP